MHALIDCDIVSYEMGSATNEDGEPLDWGLVKARVDERINGVIDAVQAHSWKGYLTGKDNFRDKVATIKPYKGHRRSKERPYWYEQIRDYLVSSRGVSIVDGMEADDAIAMAHCLDQETVICSKDKDFLQLPGKLYSWAGWNQTLAEMIDVSPLEATRFHYIQLLTGDSADNIPGLYNVGKNSALVHKVNELESELEMLEHVVEQYEKRFGSYWYQFLLENGTLLWLLRSEDDNYKMRLSRNLSELGRSPGL